MIYNVQPRSHLWSQLKSMQHALRRVTAMKHSSEITALDQSRLLDLVKFLKEQLHPCYSTELIDLMSPREFDYGIHEETKEALETSTFYKEWKSELNDEFKLLDNLAIFANTVDSGTLKYKDQTLCLIVDQILSKLLIYTESELA